MANVSAPDLQEDTTLPAAPETPASEQPIAQATPAEPPQKQQADHDDDDDDDDSDLDELDGTSYIHFHSTLYPFPSVMSESNQHVAPQQTC